MSVSWAGGAAATAPSSRGWTVTAVDFSQVGLDSEADKSVPGLCLACHGGTYNDTTNAVTDANFLPWDLDSFVYSPTPGSTRADQLEQFRILNGMVRYQQRLRPPVPPKQRPRPSQLPRRACNNADPTTAPS